MLRGAHIHFRGNGRRFPHHRDFSHRAIVGATALVLTVLMSSISPRAQAIPSDLEWINVMPALGHSAHFPTIWKVAEHGEKEMAMDDKITLSITGNIGAKFEAGCQLTIDGEEVSWDFTGTVPYSTEVSASGIRCKFTSNDRLTVEARTGQGNVTRSSTSGGTINISLN